MQLNPCSPKFSNLNLFCLVAALVTGACAADVGEDNVEGTYQDLTRRLTWGPLDEFTWRIVGTGKAANTDKEYAWYNDGWVCRGTPFNANNLCDEAVYQYSAPDSFANISGIGMAQDTNHVYAWYSDGKYSQGTSDNLTKYHGKRTFTRAKKPASEGGGFFDMSDLIEVDNSPNGEWYFYWEIGRLGQSGTHKVFRSTGTSDNAEARSATTRVSSVSTSDGRILGISFIGPGGGSTVNLDAGNLLVYYEDGLLISSSSSLVLN